MSQSTATIWGREKVARARAGVAQLPKNAYIALGNGGINEDGLLKTPTETATSLYNEVIRKPIESPEFPISTTARYKILLLTSECADVVFSEIGLFDEEDTLTAVKTFAPKQKDDDMEMIFEIDDIC